MTKRRTRFITWAKKDTKDTRRLVYTFKSDNGVEYFTSDDYVSPSMMNRIRYAWIDKIELIDNEWNVILYED